jgi:hypothetical protein
VFQRGVPQTFAPATRKTRVHFPFAWTEADAITITLPEGYAAEESAVRQTLDAGAARYDPRLTVTGSTLTFTRGLSVGTSGLFEVSIYQPLRGFFEAVHKADDQPVVLRKKDTQ